MSECHPLLNGIEAICNQYRTRPDRAGVFGLIYECLRNNWNRRPIRRFPSNANWELRTAPNFTPHPTQRLEKQLQKAIARLLSYDGWGNDVPTASGLYDKFGRQMNIDLAHRIPNGFEFVELKICSDTPYDAAMQVLRYGAIYLLYRLEPSLSERFVGNEMLTAEEIVLEVLAPCKYYPDRERRVLAVLEEQLSKELEEFTKTRAVNVNISFRFRAFPKEFEYSPGMASRLIQNAIINRRSPFAEMSNQHVAAEPSQAECSEGCCRSSEEVVQITAFGRGKIVTFQDWAERGLPIERRMAHWVEGRSAFELAREWTQLGVPSVPRNLSMLLDSRPETREISITHGVVEHETNLPFSIRGPRCHDLLLFGTREGQPVVVSIEAKADEPFGGTVVEELGKALVRPQTRFPKRLAWLTQTLLGIEAFKDDKYACLSEEVSEIPYQLLAGLAGLLLEASANKAALAVFVVHEFYTSKVNDFKIEKNACALRSFVHLITKQNPAGAYKLDMAEGHLVGPFTLPNAPERCSGYLRDQIPLFIGKVKTAVR